MKSTKKALFTSIMSLLVCVSMLVGTTFAWFTDSVTSGTNQIIAGNLDVELEHQDKNQTDFSTVTATTKLFDDVDPSLWEPGAVAYENLKVSNKGTLALKYQLSLTVANETKVTKNDAERGLSQALKVAVVPGGVDTNATRDQVVTSVAADSWASLASFTKSGDLLAKAAGASENPADVYGVVIYWEPTDHDNDFNMNNADQGKELKIDLGVNLFATQKTHEEDSFDENYDLGASTTITKVEAGESAAETQTNVITALGDAEPGDIVTLPAVNQTIDLTSKTLNADGVIIKGNDDITVKVSTGGAAPSVNADGVIFDGVKFDFGNQTYNAVRGKVIYKNCTFNGLVNSYDDSTFENCTFDNTNGQYLAHVYAGTATFTNCTFNGSNRCVYVYTDGGNASATFTNCTFTMTSVDKSAIMLNSRGSGEVYTVVINNCTQTGGNAQGTASTDGPNYDYRGLYGFKHNPGSVNGTVTVDGVVVYSNT